MNQPLHEAIETVRACRRESIFVGHEADTLCDEAEKVLTEHDRDLHILGAGNARLELERDRLRELVRRAREYVNDRANSAWPTGGASYRGPAAWLTDAKKELGE